jgi:hypothetical protein
MNHLHSAGHSCRPCRTAGLWRRMRLFAERRHTEVSAAVDQHERDDRAGSRASCTALRCRSCASPST